MGYAIIRNVKYKRGNLGLAYRHNERENKNYSNKDIDLERSYLNYHLKEPILSYEKEFDKLKKENDYKGQIKAVSNIACEYVITSNKEFFDEIGEEETRRYFETAYEFVSNYKNLGEKNILSAVVHMDETTPHMHLIFVPVVHTIDKKGREIDKIACSEFWKSKDSYRQLQDAFHKYMISHDFMLERGNSSDREHYTIKEYKDLTNFEETKELVKQIPLETPKMSDIKDIKKVTINRDEKIQEQIVKPRDELIKELHNENINLKKRLIKQKNLVEKAEDFEIERDFIIDNNVDLEVKCKNLERENTKLQNKIQKLEKAIESIKETIGIFFNWVCHKFALSSKEELIKNFEEEKGIKLDYSIKKENKELDLKKIL